VSLLKDSSLAYIVGVPEFTFLANQVNNRLMIYLVRIFLFIGAVYLLLRSLLQYAATRLLTGPGGTRNGQARTGCGWRGSERRGIVGGHRPGA
jgi:polar amino acid transport system permease protein